MRFALQSRVNPSLASLVAAPGAVASPPVEISIYADPVVALYITEYTLDSQFLQVDDRAFTFYPTTPFAFLAVQGALYIPPPVQTLPLGPVSNCTSLCLDIQRFEGTFPTGLVELQGGPLDAAAWSTGWAIVPPSLLLDLNQVTHQIGCAI